MFESFYFVIQVLVFYLSFGSFIRNFLTQIFRILYFVTQTFIVILCSFDSFIRNFWNEVKVSLHLQFSPPAVAVSQSLTHSVSHSFSQSLTHSLNQFKRNSLFLLAERRRENVCRGARVKMFASLAKIAEKIR